MVTRESLEGEGGLIEEEQRVAEDFNQVGFPVQGRVSLSDPNQRHIRLGGLVGPSPGGSRKPNEIICIFSCLQGKETVLYYKERGISVIVIWRPGVEWGTLKIKGIHNLIGEEGEHAWLI